MKIFVRTLGGGSSFGIEVKPEDMVADVKKTIETTKGADTYPAVQQMLFHQGKVLKDGTTLEENKVAENNFVVIMLRKNKGSAGEGSTMSSAPSLKAPLSSTPPTASTSVATGPPPAVVPAPAPIPASIAVPDIYDQASSNLVAGDNLEVAIQQILDMGGGTWDRDTVVRALHAAYNNPESAVEYLYSGIPEWAEAPPTSRRMSSGQAANMCAQPQQPAEPTPFRSAGPNTNPLNLFPRGQQAGAIPQVTTVTPKERESIERIEAMGFNRTLVLEAFFACNKNEELAANYLLDHIHEFQE